MGTSNTSRLSSCCIMEGRRCLWNIRTTLFKHKNTDTASREVWLNLEADITLSCAIKPGWVPEQKYSIYALISKNILKTFTSKKVQLYEVKHSVMCVKYVADTYCMHQAAWLTVKVKLIKTHKKNGMSSLTQIHLLSLCKCNKTKKYCITSTCLQVTSAL